MNKYKFSLLFVLYSSVLCAQKQELDEFNFKMFNEMCADKPNENIIYSPVSMNLTLGMILNGADEESQKKIKDAMGLSTYSMEQLNECLNNSLERVTYTYGDNYFSVEAHNSVWLQNGYDYNKNYVDTLNKYYKAHAFNVDFTSVDGIDSINKWNEKITSSLVKRHYDCPQPNRVLDIESVLCFKDEWGLLTNNLQEPMVFNNANGRKIEVDAINMKGYNRLYGFEMNGYDIVRLNFGNSQHGCGEEGSSYIPSRFETYLMYVFSPQDTQTIQPFNYAMMDVISSLSHLNFIGDLDMIMPIFTFYENVSLDSYFTKLTGVNIQYDVILSGITKNTISCSSTLLKQILCFDINNVGSTSVTQTNLNKNKRIIKHGLLETVLNHPFYFIITNEESQDILFMGRIKNLNGEDISEINYVPDEEKKITDVYDIYGRKYSSTSKPGIYIIDGKKKVVKDVK